MFLGLLSKTLVLCVKAFVLKIFQWLKQTKVEANHNPAVKIYNQNIQESSSCFCLYQYSIFYLQNGSNVFLFLSCFMLYGIKLFFLFMKNIAYNSLLSSTTFELMASLGKRSQFGSQLTVVSSLMCSWSEQKNLPLLPLLRKE